MIYLDTSAALKLVVAEPETGRIDGTVRGLDVATGAVVFRQTSGNPAGVGG